MESKNQDSKNAVSHVATEEAGWKSKAQIAFMQFRQDTTDLPLLQIMLKDLIKALQQEKTNDIVNDTFCKELAAFFESFSANVPHQEIDKTVKINTLMYTGDFLALLRKFDTAHFCYDQIIKLDPNWDLGYVSKADAYCDAYEIDKAIEYFKKAIDVNPLQSGTYYNLAMYQKQNRHYKESYQTFHSFLSFADPADSYNQNFIKMAKIWIRYLEKKMELFGEKYEY